MTRKQMNKTKPKQYRQGDVLITETNRKTKPPGDKQPPGPITVAHGEATGHHHTIECDQADWWKGDGVQVVDLAAPGTLTHQEHGPIPLKARRHTIRRQSEYSPQEIRRVAD